MDYLKNKPVLWRQEMFLFTYRREYQKSVRFFHSHEGLELLYVHQGTGKVMVEESLYTVGPHTLIVIQPNQMHHTDISPPYCRTLLKIKPFALQELLPLLPSVACFFRSITEYQLPHQVFSCTDRQDQDLDLMFRQLSDLLSLAKPEEAGERVALFFLHLLSYLESSVFPQGEHVLPLPSRHADRVLQWIEEHYRKPFKLQQLADELHLSPTYLSKYFHDQAQMTLTEYLTERRLRQANLLLRATSKPIEQISRESGFQDASYFSRIFKRKYGMTPAQYRTTQRRQTMM